MFNRQQSMNTDLTLCDTLQRLSSHELVRGQERFPTFPLLHCVLPLIQLLVCDGRWRLERKQACLKYFLEYEQVCVCVCVIYHKQITIILYNIIYKNVDLIVVRIKSE